jgi:hypothetical protein
MGDSRRSHGEGQTGQPRGSGEAAIEERSDEMQVRPNRAGRDGAVMVALLNWLA